MACMAAQLCQEQNNIASKGTSYKGENYKILNEIWIPESKKRSNLTTEAAIYHQESSQIKTTFCLVHIRTVYIHIYTYM